MRGLESVCVLVRLVKENSKGAYICPRVSALTDPRYGPAAASLFVLSTEMYLLYL